VYINDIVNGIQGNVKLFADDTVLYVDVDRCAEAESILQRDLDLLQKWSDKWLVKLSSEKTVHMKVSLKHNTELPNVHLGNKVLHSVLKYKHLGLAFFHIS